MSRFTRYFLQTSTRTTGQGVVRQAASAETAFADGLVGGMGIVRHSGAPLSRIPRAPRAAGHAAARDSVPTGAIFIRTAGHAALR
ncbi:hypothetical protein [Frondihabitans cladoniiphilus]|uniref:Uncharacterized protein n=1 Tax=Frondihabitans cladoniiphilus TaxID=715785 RepID=A0ABP8VUY4_9MICO